MSYTIIGGLKVKLQNCCLLEPLPDADDLSTDSITLLYFPEVRCHLILDPRDFADPQYTYEVVDLALEDHEDKDPWKFFYL